MRRILFAIVLTLVMAGVVSAQGPKINFYAGGGMAMPMGPETFKDYWSMGLSFGGGVGFQQSDNIEIRGTVFYNKFDFDEEALNSFIGIPGASGITYDGGEFTVIEVLGSLKYLLGMPEASARPYLLGSVGFGGAKVASMTVSYEGESATSPEQSESKVMFGAGAGVDVKLSPTACFFAEGQFLYVSTEGDATTYLPIRGGIRLTVGQ